MFWQRWSNVNKYIKWKWSKIDIIGSASKRINNNQKENEDRRKEKKYTITLDNIPKRIKFIKEKALKEKKSYEK